MGFRLKNDDRHKVNKQMKAAEQFEVSGSSAIRWVQRFRENGTGKPSPRRVVRLDLRRRTASRPERFRLLTNHCRPLDAETLRQIKDAWHEHRAAVPRPEPQRGRPAAVCILFRRGRQAGAAEAGSNRGRRRAGLERHDAGQRQARCQRQAARHARPRRDVVPHRRRASSAAPCAAAPSRASRFIERIPLGLTYPVGHGRSEARCALLMSAAGRRRPKRTSATSKTWREALSPALPNVRRHRAKTQAGSTACCRL